MKMSNSFFTVSPPEPGATERLTAALSNALDQISTNFLRFSQVFPDDTTCQQVYQPRKASGFAEGSNTGWTTGFWTGMLWMAYELQGRQDLLEGALSHLDGYEQRLIQRINVDHHDLGFLYTPSCVSAFYISGNTRARGIALAAADHLLGRFLPQAGIIQAWGDLHDPAQRGRIIIDCLMNLPLLHWASQTTGKAHYRNAAVAHLVRSRDHLVRSDDSSFHTFHFDATSGEPLRGSTAQGAADNSCWARGQAWGIYGFALNHRYAPDLRLLDVALRLAEHFLARLPQNGIAHWDLIFEEGSAEPLDSSASAIAVCGLLEISQALPEGEPREFYRNAALKILLALATHCAAPAGDSAPLLLHGVYSKPHQQGIDEGNLWGDFFYLEALARCVRGWPSYW